LPSALFTRLLARAIPVLQKQVFDTNNQVISDSGILPMIEVKLRAALLAAWIEKAI